MLGPDSQTAAEGSVCAAEANKFYPYRDKLFENQRNPDAYTRANLIKYATQVGIDTQAFSSCLDSGRATAQVRADIDEGRRLGVKAVPTMAINGQTIEGLGPVEVYKARIDAELNK